MFFTKTKLIFDCLWTWGMSRIVYRNESGKTDNILLKFNMMNLDKHKNIIIKIVDVRD
jgi:hypothetical protein